MAPKGGSTWDPKKDRFRFVVLLVICFVYMATSQAKSTPKNFKKQLGVEEFAGQKIDTMFSVHTLPTIALALIATCVMNHFGPNKTLMIFVGLCAFGQLLCMLAFDPFIGTTEVGGGVFWLFIIGRFFNGVGVGAFRVAGNILIKNWFPDKELSMVMTGFVRQGDTAGVIIDANAVGKIGTNGMRFLFGTLFITFSFVSVFVLYLRPSAVESKNDGNISLYGAITKQMKRIVQDSKEFPRVYWVLVSVLVCYDGVATPFMSMAGSMVANAMKEYYNESEFDKSTTDVLTANIRSLTKYVCILGPFIGIMVDRIGKRCFFLFTMGVSMGTMMCVISAMEPKSLGTGIIPLMILLGLSHSLMSTCLWPVFGKVVKKTGIASAYGVASSLNAVACSITPEIRNALADNPTGFGIFCCIGIGIGMTIVVYLFINHSKEIGNHAPKRVWPGETPKKKNTELDTITVDDAGKPTPASAP